jgi:hypothetical protein
MSTRLSIGLHGSFKPLCSASPGRLAGPSFKGFTSKLASTSVNGSQRYHGTSTSNLLLIPIAAVLTSTSQYPSNSSTPTSSDRDPISSLLSQPDTA